LRDNSANNLSLILYIDGKLFLYFLRNGGVDNRDGHQQEALATLSPNLCPSGRGGTVVSEEQKIEF
jgi:hypothetical protein